MSFAMLIFRNISLFLLITLTACGINYPGDKIDPAGNLTRQDYIDLRERGKKSKDKEKNALTTNPIPIKVVDRPLIEQIYSGPPPIPDLPPITIPKDDDEGKPELLVSLSVAESMALRDVFLELARKAKVNIEIDPRIEGGVIFTAHRQPFETVLRRLCDLAGLRYSKEEEFIRIQKDEPYYKSYTLDYLSLARKTTSEVSIATNVFDTDISSNSKDSNAARGEGAGDNNSTAKVSSLAEADFWKEVEKTLPHIMTSAKGTPKSKNTFETSSSVDRQAGLITIYGTERQQRAIESYLKQLYTKATAQVLIEARIIEVELDEEFKSGINWSQLFRDSVGIAANFGAPGLGAAMTTATSGLFTAAIDSKDFSGLMNLVRTFGTTRVLSSPRLTVVNNQTAVLKVARNEVYFVTSAQFPTSVNASGVVVSGTPVFSSTPRTVPVGLVMTVQPAINTTHDRITMTLRPTISRVVDHVSDPSIGLNAANAGVTKTLDSKIPVLAVREMDSVLQLQSGEVAIMGGLMQDSSENQDQGVPPFDSAPILGNLAKSRENEGKTSELVILLRATIMKNATPDQADKGLYEKYNNDPRPLKILKRRAE